MKELKEKGLHDFQRRFVNLAQFVPRQSATLFEDVMCIVCLLFCTVICMRFRLELISVTLTVHMAVLYLVIAFFVKCLKCMYNIVHNFIERYGCFIIPACI